MKLLLPVFLIALIGQNSPAQHTVSARTETPRPKADRTVKNPEASARISDAFAKAELLALKAIEDDRGDSPMVTRSDGSFIPSTQVVWEAADSQAVTAEEKLISSQVLSIYSDNYIVIFDSIDPAEGLRKSPTLAKEINELSRRIRTCIDAEEGALGKRAATIPRVCNDDVISPPETKEEMAADQKKIDAEIQAAEKRESLAIANNGSSRKDIPTIAKAADGSIVSIVMSDKDGKPIAQGSGFLVSSDGLIVTNYHVIAEGTSAVVKLPEGSFYVVDGVVASDKVRDVAVIKAHGSNFRTLILGDSDGVQVGEDVVAIGTPLSLESTVSNGIVSGMRTAEEEGGKFLQITAPISPGSSGGPLFNMAGEVVGITTLYLNGGENLNFAIPINDAKLLLQAKSSRLRPLPNETEPIQSETQQGEPPPVSLDEKAGCANLVEQEGKREGLIVKPGGSITRSSHFDAESLICFEILTLYSGPLTDSDGKRYEGVSIVVNDVVEGTSFAVFNSASEVTKNSSSEVHPGSGYVKDKKGHFFALKENRSIEDFGDLLFAKLGIRL